ncbi:MAG: PD-(D/E)XK nuclease family protein, partial [Patescibacteria group bacterium]
KNETEYEKKAADQKPYELPKTISFTQIAAFSSCPLQYKFAHILKVPVFGRHSLSFGKSMHNTLQRFMELVLSQQVMPQASLFDQSKNEPPKLPTPNELQAIYNQCWIDEWYPNENLKQEYYDKGKASLMEYYNILDKNLPTIKFLEKGFTLKLAGVTLKGRIDRIDEIGEGYEIVDYKTGSPKSQLSWQEKKQLVLYQMAAEQCFDPPLIIKRLTYHYLENNSVLSFEATQKDKEKLTKEIQDTVEQISSSGFKATPGFHCSYCDFKDICEFSQS